MSKPFTLPDEQPQPATDMPSQSMSAYQALQNFWTQPPQPLPGPDDHPFFKMFAPNAYGSLLQPDSIATVPETHTVPDAEIALEEPAFEMPLVYPFVPAPSINMEPMTPENVCATPPIQTPAASISQPSTPSLSFSNSDGHESSPESHPSSAKSPKGARFAKTRDTESKGEEVTPPAPATITNQKSAKEDPDKMEVDAICILTYMRAIPNSETSEPAVIANGQIWRSPDKKKGWRRNQWIVDVR